MIEGNGLRRRVQIVERSWSVKRSPTISRRAA